MQLKLEISSFEGFLYEEDILPSTKDNLSEKITKRNIILTNFSHAIILKTFYHQVDFANWLLWQLLGSRYGDCIEGDSDIHACTHKGKHRHEGVWTTFWIAKTGYDYGFNEWYFKKKRHSDLLVKVIPILEQMYCCGLYADKYFWNFLSDVSKKTNHLNEEEKLAYFLNINWRDITNEILNETYNF